MCGFEPESRCCHDVAHSNVDTLIIPFIMRNVLRAPQQRRQVLTERDGLELSRYHATRGLE